MSLTRLAAIVWCGVALAVLARAADFAEMPPAQQANGVTLLPLRYIAEWFGATVRYQAAAGAIRLEVRGRTVQFTPGQSTAYLDGHPVTLFTPALVRDDLTYVPVRFLAEALGAQVDAHYDTAMQLQTVSIRDPRSGDALLVRVAPAQSPPPLTVESMQLFEAVDRGEMVAVKQRLETAPALVRVRDVEGNTPLLRAVAHGQPQVAMQLLRHGAEIDADNQAGQTALHLAALDGQRDLAALLIAHGAHFNLKDALGQTPLHLAARAGHTAVARALLDFGATVDIRDLYGQTPLLDAVRARRQEMVMLLLGAGASTAVHDIDLYTPLHRAAAIGATEIVATLLQHGADARARAKGGKTPLELAREQGFSAIVELLTPPAKKP